MLHKIVILKNFASFTGKHLRFPIIPKIPNPGVPCSKSMGASKVDSDFHPSEVDQMSTWNIWELSGKK